MQKSGCCKNGYKYDKLSKREFVAKMASKYAYFAKKQFVAKMTKKYVQYAIVVTGRQEKYIKVGLEA